MKRSLILLVCAVLTFACGAAVQPPDPEQPPAPYVLAAPVFTATAESVNTEIHIDTTTIEVVTDTYLHEWMSLDAPETGQIYEGEIITAVCCADNPNWCRVPEGWFCLPAAIGTGGCE